MSTATGRPVAFGLNVGTARPLAQLEHGDLPIPVGVTQLGDLANVDLSTSRDTVDRPMIWRQGSDRVWRMELMPNPETAWGQQIRMGDTAPPDDLIAPHGAVWVDVTTGRIYRAEIS